MIAKAPQFAKLLRLSRSELTDLLAAQAALIRAQLLVWTRPTGRLVAAGDANSDAIPAPDVERVIGRLEVAVARAAGNGPLRPSCLVRAVALQRLLERHGLRGSRIRVGVRWLDGRFAAHAWVEYGERIVGDRSRHVRGYAPLTDVQLVGKV